MADRGRFDVGRSLERVQGRGRQLLEQNRAQARLSGVIETQQRFKATGLSEEEAIMAAFEQNAHDLARVGGK